MGASERKYRVAFDKPLDGDDGQGGYEDGWTEVWQCDAKVKFLRGGETVQQARLASTRPVVIYVLNCSEARTVEEHFRVRLVREGAFDGSNWVGTLGDITSIAPSEDLSEKEITAVLREAR